MTLPYVFANVSQLNTPELDADFNALGALVTIPCTATGTNTIVLTPTANTPTLSAYSSLAPQFAFIAAATSAGAVTVNINGLGAKKLFKNQGAVQCGASDITSGGLYTIIYNATLDSAVGGFVLTNQTLVVSAPTVQKFTSGSGATYTPTAGMVRIKVRTVGGGGGAGAVALNAAAVAGGASSFAAGTWVAAGGGLGGAAGGAGGAAGAGGANGTGTLVARIIGEDGNAGAGSGTGGVNIPSGKGGSTPLGGGGNSISTAGTGSAGKTNTGGGGGGGYTTSGNSGGGGGAGEYVEFWMTAAQVGASTTYTVGAGGAGGTAGTQAGGAGAAGVIIVEEFYI